MLADRVAQVFVLGVESALWGGNGKVKTVNYSEWVSSTENKKSVVVPSDMIGVTTMPRHPDVQRV